MVHPESGLWRIRGAQAACESVEWHCYSKSKCLFINRHIVCKKCEIILRSCTTWIAPQLQYEFPEGLEKVELVQKAVVGEVVSEAYDH